MAFEARADRREAGHSTLNPVEVTYYGPHPSASAAMFMDHSSRPGSELGGFMDPCSSRQLVERAVTSNWGNVIPTMTGARTSTTTTLTSTYVTCSTVGGPVYVQYARGPPSTGLTSVRPARQVFVSQSVEPSGSFPRARVGLGTLRPEVGNLETIWGDLSTRSNLQPEVDRSQVASRPEDRALEPVASGERYQSHGQGGNSVAVWQADSFSQGGHGTRPRTSVEPRQMDSAGAEAGSVGLLPGPGASVLSSGSMKVGYVVPCNLRQSCPPSEVHAYPPPRMDVQLIEMLRRRILPHMETS